MRMVVNLDRLFSNRSKVLKASEIRELLKLTQMPGMISLAGGLPNPKAFPLESIHECIEQVFDQDIESALQYGTTEGLPELREAIAERMTETRGIECDLQDVIITNGAQQAISFVAFNLLNPGDTYITGVPAYLAALQTFHAFEANCEAIPLEDDGLDLQSLHRNIVRLIRTGILPKFIYTVPNFENPSGVTMSLSKRQQLLEIASKFDLLIVEDDPYGELRFEGKTIPPIKSLDTKGRVIYISTFSKILAPGFRLGWVVASKEILKKFVLTKQMMDLCTNVFSQYIAAKYVAGGYLDKHLADIRDFYKHKREVVVEALEQYFPQEAKWNVPEGGMFVWISLPKEIDTRVMFQKALMEKVAYVVGEAFYPEGGTSSAMRVNFSYVNDELLREGIKRLGAVIDQELDMLQSLHMVNKPITGL